MAISHYEQYLLESPELTKELSDMYWGMEPPQEVTLRFSNADGYFSTLIQSEELRNKTVRIRRYDPNESGSNRLRFEMFGVITDYNILDEAEITVTLNNPDPMQTKLPRHVYDMTSFSESRPLIYNPPDDLGAPYPLIFGRVKKVPCVYVHYNSTANQYDYIVGRGPIESIGNVYGDKVKRKPVTDYTSFDGSQLTPYPGYAFIRFKWDQMNFDLSWCEITADVNGLKMGAATAQRNFAYVIKEFMSNATWGLGLAVNNPAFEQAALDLEDYYCDGAIIEQRTGQDILNELLFACKGRLSQNEDGEWLLHIDKAATTEVAAYFGSGEGKWENIMEITKYGKTPTSNCPKTVVLNYNYDFETTNYLSKYERGVFSFGEERVYETPFIRDHTTADKLTCHLKNLAYYTDTKLEMTVGQEGRHLSVWDKCDIQITRFGIESQMRIKALSKRLESFDLGLESHNNLIYAYTPTTRYNIDPDMTSSEQADPIDDDSDNFQRPKTPINIAGLSWGYSVSGTGTVTAHLLGTMTKAADDVNFAYMLVGVRLWDSTNTNDYSWYTPYKYSHSTGEWRIVLNFPASSLPTSTAFVEATGGRTNYFDAQVVSVNAFGTRSLPKYFYGEAVDWKQTQVGTVPVVPTKITTISTYSSFKNFVWSWTPCDVLDLRDYHVQVGTSSGASNLANTYMRSNTYSYTTSQAFGSVIYFRVRPRNTTCIEAWVGVNNWTDATCTVENTIYIPDDSITKTMIADISGIGMSQAAGGELNVNYDNSTIGINGSDQIYVKADGIGASHIADDAVGSDQIADNAVGNAQIADNAVTEVEIRFGSTSTGASAGADTLPANPIGFINVDVGGTTRRVPYYGT